MKAFAALFARMIARPLRAEPVRTLLNVFAVALGVAVVVAIEMSSGAATGSFRSSMETLSGDAALEITATGGIEETLLGRLSTLPLPLRLVPRIEGFAVVGRTRAYAPLIGVDLLGFEKAQTTAGGGDQAIAPLRDSRSIWVNRGMGLAEGETVSLTVQDRTEEYVVRGLLDYRDNVIVMDIGAAQIALRRAGRLDRIEVHIPAGTEIEPWRKQLTQALPEGVTVRAHGASTEENRKMLAAFRWNLRVLSYISLVVGAFLIYNTISVSVVRRRAEIGIVRALGGSRWQVMALFLAESGAFGLLGSALGLPLGRLMAEGAVKLLAATVEALYVSSRPGDIEWSWTVLVEALVVGFGVSVAAAFGPAREAAGVAPVEAMARGQREVSARIHVWRNLAVAVVVAALAAWLTTFDAWEGRPIAGYAATLLLILASALAIPSAVTLVSRLFTRAAEAILGVEGRLAARGILAALPRTSVLVGALSTAVAMMVSVGLMVGSFRETVAMWMESQLKADFYLRPAGGGGASRYPAMSPEVPDRIAKIPGVRAVDRFRIYEISYQGLPALLGGGESKVVASGRHTGLLPGVNREEVLAKLPTGDYAIVSEPFANKHKVRVGDRLAIGLGAAKPVFEVLGIYFDYSNERGYVVIDRATLLKYLPDPAVSNLAVYLDPRADSAAVKREIESAIAGRAVLLFENRNLREEALKIFDRTFAITWALELVAIFVAVLGVTGALMALVIDRRREMGLLRFLGASPGQVRRLILCEAGLLGLLSNGTGFALGYCLSLILIYVINVQSFGWTIQFHWPVKMLVTVLTLIYASTVLAALYPGQIAARLNPIEVIHEE